jgi:hypothetical protein
MGRHCGSELCCGVAAEPSEPPVPDDERRRRPSERHRTTFAALHEMARLLRSGVVAALVLMALDA